MACKQQDECANAEYCNFKVCFDVATCVNFKQKYKPLTNEEWFCSLPTKEKAKVFVDIAQDDFYALRLQYYGEANDDVDAFAMWLKEKYKECTE